jgi:hypothetical protein
MEDEDTEDTDEEDTDEKDAAETAYYTLVGKKGKRAATSSPKRKTINKKSQKGKGKAKIVTKEAHVVEKDTTSKKSRQE